MTIRKETRIRRTAENVSGETENSATVEMSLYCLTDKQEDNIRELLKDFWVKVKRIVEESERG